MTNKQSKYRSYIKFLFLGLFIIFLFFADQYTKYLAVRNLSGRKEISFISGLISFSYVENRGMAWGMLSGKIVFFIVLTGLLIAFIAYSICRIEKLTILMPQKTGLYTFLQFCLSILIAGAFGNLADRIKNGYVVDFIKTDFIDFPVFNVADCYVTISMVLLIIIVLFFIKEDDLNQIFSFKKLEKG